MYADNRVIQTAGYIHNKNTFLALNYVSQTISIPTNHPFGLLIKKSVWESPNLSINEPDF